MSLFGRAFALLRSPHTAYAFSAENYRAGNAIMAERARKCEREEGAKRLPSPAILSFGALLMPPMGVVARTNQRITDAGDVLAMQRGEFGEADRISLSKPDRF